MEVMSVIKNKRRTFGEHLTSKKIFYEYILPYIRDILYDYIWVDLYAGEGNLILPILKLIPEPERIDFFKERIFLFEIQPELVKKAIQQAEYYGIPKEIGMKNIILKDTLQEFPKEIVSKKFPVFHITNPPYLYIGYIVKQGGRNLTYFRGINEGYQDLYQIALMNDLRNNVSKMIYIIPSNFLFGDAGSNKIRKDFLKFYFIQMAYIFEDKVFEYTGTNVGIFFFERKKYPHDENLKFIGIKIKNGDREEREYTLKTEGNYRAGNNFQDFIMNYKAKKPIEFKFYLTEALVSKNSGDELVEVIDANSFNGKSYESKKIHVSKGLKSEILSNILFVRTVDTGAMNGRVGLYEIKKVFNVDGIFTNNPFRTHPIQIFFYPKLSVENQLYLLKYFNLVLEYFREIDDSEFLTTFKYSDSIYTRKYLGLTKVKQLIQTFPILDITEYEITKFKNLIDKKDIVEIIDFIKNKNDNNQISLFLR